MCFIYVGSVSVDIVIVNMLPMIPKPSLRNLFVSKLLSIDPRIFLWGIHALITLGMIGCFIASAILIYISDIDFVNNRFLMHGFIHTPYFFSLWVTAAEFLCFGIYSIIDVLGVYGQKSTKVRNIRKKLHNIASQILFSLVFPLSIVVLVLFWGFFMWNRELIYPEIMDKIFPSFLNHMMHTYPVPVSILYMFTDIKTEPPKSKTLAFLTVFIVIYFLVFFEVRRRGTWVYFLFYALTPSQIALVLISMVIGAYIFYFLGYYISSKIRVMRSYMEKELKKLIYLSGQKVKEP